jgi:hypothetical protein
MVPWSIRIILQTRNTYLGLSAKKDRRVEALVEVLRLLQLVFVTRELSTYRIGIALTGRQCTRYRYRWLCSSSCVVLRCYGLETLVWPHQQVCYFITHSFRNSWTADGVWFLLLIVLTASVCLASLWTQ